MQAPRTVARAFGLALTLSLAVMAVTSASANTRSGNYLVVTPPDFHDSAPLNEFIAAKTTMGFNMMTYVVPTGTSKEAIRAYIRDLWGTSSAPAYILLVGDTAGSSTSTSSTIPYWVGQASRHACSDVYYACMDDGDDWQPEIAIGRFSVANIGQLQNVVDKTLYIEAGVFDDPDYVKRAVMLASNDMTSGAEETHNWVIENCLEPAEFDVTRVYARLGGGTSQISAAVNNGVLLTVYGGHSGSSGWSTPAFNQSNVRALDNVGLYGLTFGWSCNTAHFSYDECFGETWIREANKGSAAYLSASDYIFWGGWDDWEPSRQLEKYFFEAIFNDGVREVGPAWLIALSEFLDDYGSDPSYPSYLDRTRNLFEEMVLLGDPSLYLPEGHGFKLNPDPLTRIVCSPPTDEATYTIDVEQVGDFTEPITLSLSDAPPGVSVSFSVNPVTPPGTSVMTVSNLTTLSPGEYSISVAGSASALVRSVSVGLSVSDESPGAVTLTNPPNGEVDVARSPTLTWQASAQAVEYDLEIATDLSFTNIVYTATGTTTNRVVGTALDPAALYFWHVRAVNGCGDSGFSPAFNFTTIEEAEYFTEQFASGFDLANFSVSFVPDGSGNHYDMCGTEITALPTDPAGGTPLDLRDDTYEQINLAGSRTVELYGLGYTSLYVGSNGYITFGTGDSEYAESLDNHFNLPRISALFDDLDPGSGGTVSWEQFDDRAVVTFEDVPERSAGNANTFQIEMFFGGKVTVSWLNVDVGDAIVGISSGEGVPSDYLESDVSAVGSCGPEFLLIPDPASLDVCAPDDAVYTIDVDTVAGFTGQVTLSVSGAPDGTTAQFSVNPVTPPGTTVLTISGTDAALIGEYSVVLNGSSSQGDRSIVVGLAISSGSPGDVALTDPADGAMGADRSPTLVWEPVAGAFRYDLQVATDPGFTQVVYTTTTNDAEHTVEAELGGATPHYWHVRAINGCGSSGYSSPFEFTTVDVLNPYAYDMLNGETGSYNYFDDLYDGDGDPTQALSPLSGGLGDLTDGVIATQSWDSTSGPYVGWVSVDPTITCYFENWVRIRRVVLHVDDSNGSGGVYPPEDVTLVMGDETLVFPITDPSGGQPFAIELDDLGLTGNMLEITLADHSTGGYMMLSELEFYGWPCPGDLDGDGEVGLADLAALLANYDTSGDLGYEDGDLDGDDDVDLADLATLLSVYGGVCD